MRMTPPGGKKTIKQNVLSY